LLDIAPSDYRKFSVNLTGIDTTTSADHRQSVNASVSDEQITKVIESRPDIKSLIARLESQQASVDILSGSLLPRLDANAGLSGSGSNSNLSKIQPSNFFTGGLSLSFPLFNKWQTRLQIDEQNVNIESNRIRLNQAEQQLRSDVAKAANNLLFADESLDASDYALRSAEESLRLATERLNVGAGIQLDVIVAQSQVETARTNRVNAVFNYVLAQKQVQYTLGQWNY
jgi:outer membrane protein